MDYEAVLTLEEAARFDHTWHHIAGLCLFLLHANNSVCKT
jgi:hypothetical protein